jgi:hypothetical protein
MSLGLLVIVYENMLEPHHVPKNPLLATAVLFPKVHKQSTTIAANALR